MFSCFFVNKKALPGRVAKGNAFYVSVKGVYFSALMV